MGGGRWGWVGWAEMTLRPATHVGMLGEQNQHASVAECERWRWQGAGWGECSDECEAEAGSVQLIHRGSQCSCGRGHAACEDDRRWLLVFRGTGLVVGVQGVGAAHARLFAGAAVALVMVTRAVALRHTAGSPRIFE